MRLKTLYFSHWLSAPGDSRLGEINAFSPATARDLIPLHVTEMEGCSCWLPFEEFKTVLYVSRLQGLIQSSLRRVEGLQWQQLPGSAGSLLLVKLMVRLLWAIWPLRAAAQRARSSKLLSKERWSDESKSHYAIFHTIFFPKKDISVQTVGFNHHFSSYLGPKNMQYLLLLVIIFKQLFCHKVLLCNNFILIFLSVEIFMLREWQMTQTSPEILVS